MKKHFLLLICLLSITVALPACNLGMHEWERALMLDFSLPGPLLPAAEVSIINDRLAPHEAGNLIWTAESFESLAWAFITRKLLPQQWPLAQTWSYTSTDRLDKSGIDRQTLLINPHSYKLRILLFRDKLSNYRCHQLVIIQEGRMRLAMPNSTPPLAEEYIPRTWLSLFFFDQPLPEQIMTLTLAPLRGQQQQVYMNSTFIETLLNEELIIRRPADFLLQYPEGFPLPEN